MAASPWYTPPTRLAWTGLNPKPASHKASSQDEDVAGHWTQVINGTARVLSERAGIARRTYADPFSGATEEWVLGQSVYSVPLRSAWDQTWTVDGAPIGAMLPYYLPGQPGFQSPPTGPYTVEYEGFAADDRGAGELVPSGQQQARIQIGLLSFGGSFPIPDVKVSQVIGGDPGVTQTPTVLPGYTTLDLGSANWQSKAALDALDAAGRFLVDAPAGTFFIQYADLATPLDPTATALFLQAMTVNQSTTNPYAGSANFSLTFNVVVDVGIEYQGPRYRFLTPRIPPLRQRQRDDRYRRGTSKQSSTRQGSKGTYW